MWIPLIVLLGAIMLGAIGQICLKFGLGALGAKPALFVVLSSMFRNWFGLGGFVAYGVSSLLYLFVLSRLELSYAYPMVALNYVFVTILACLILKEVVPPARILGLAIICLGVVVRATSYGAAGPGKMTTGASPAIEASVDQG